MTDGLNTIIYPVKDLDAAKALFGALLGSSRTPTSRTTSATRPPDRTSASTRTGTPGA